MEPIKTIVLMDLETTGLPFEEHNETRTTEVALVACERDHILKGEDCFPRILHKLIIPLNPQRQIVDVVSNKTGLTNQLLENLQPFDGNFIQILKLFLKRLPKPVCLIAQNGKKFDFPILQRQLSEFHSQLASDLYCIDSQDVFRHIMPQLGKNYRIDNIYKTLHNGEMYPDAHRAESDCMAILSCILKRKEQFFAYMDMNVTKFNSVKPLQKLTWI